MKIMTCKQMGGPCDAQISGSNPQEMLKRGLDHLSLNVDPDHQAALKMMKAMDPDSPEAKQWHADFEVKFSQLS